MSTNGETPLVSIALTTYNESAIIKECLMSLLNQDYPYYEVVLVDGGSSDSTLEIAKRTFITYGHNKNVKRLLAVEDKNAKSPPLGLNAAAGLAEGKLVAFIGADCIAEKNWISNLVRALQDSSIAIAGGPNVSIHNRKSGFLSAIDSVLSSFLGSGGSLQTSIPKQEKFVSVTAGCNMMIRADILKRLDGFDSHLLTNEDTDLCLRVKKLGLKIKYVPNALVYHHVGYNSFFGFIKFIFGYGKGRGHGITRKINLLSKPVLASFISTFVLFLSLFLYLVGIQTSIVFVLGFLTAYLFLVLVFSTVLALKKKLLSLTFYSIPILIVQHFTYTIGLYVGLLRGVLSKR